MQERNSQKVKGDVTKGTETDNRYRGEEGYGVPVLKIINTMEICQKVMMGGQDFEKTLA